MRKILKNTLIAVVVIIAIKVMAFFMDRWHEKSWVQSEVNEMYADISKKPKEELDQFLLKNEKSTTPSTITQNELESLVQAQNKTYPKTSPSGIRIDRVTSGPSLITYHKTMVGFSRADLDIESIDSESFRASLKDEVCSNLGARNFLRSGISFRIIQLDRNGELIYDFTAHPGECVL